MLLEIEEFETLLQEIAGRTLVATDRCLMIYQFAKYSNALPGVCAEVGAYRGGTARLIARSCPDKSVHVFDTFAGMPQSRPDIDRHKEGDFSDTSFDDVQSYLGDCDNVRLHPGQFPATAQTLQDTRFGLVNVDVDIYQSALACLEFFYPRVVPGGVILLDDYEWEGCPGIKKAVDDFMPDKPEVPIVTARYQCAVIRT